MDTIFLGGQVLTMAPDRARAQAIAIRDGKIHAIGKSAEIAGLITEQTQVVQLEGRCVVPGFIDPHTHFSVTTFEPIAVDCRIPPLSGKPAVLEAIAAAAEAAPAGRWILGFGYSARRGREPAVLERRDLDAVAPNHPVCIIDSSCHACYVNSEALRLAQIDRSTRDLDGGQIVRGEDGEASGPLWERAVDALYRMSMGSLAEAYGTESMLELVERNARRHLACGLTSIGDAAVTPEAAAMYRTADDCGRLPLTVHQLRAGNGFFAAPEPSPGDFARPPETDRLRGGSMKLFMDPVFPRNAGMHIHPGGHREMLGRPYYEQQEVDELAVAAAKLGQQVAIHCLGTWAIEQGLHALEQASRYSDRADPRHRIEHFSQPRREQIERAAELGVTVVTQPSFFYQSGERSVELLRAAGIDTAPAPYRTLLDAGVNVVGSSDSPCGPLEPLLGIYSIVSRRTRDQNEPVAPEEAITAEEALSLYTIRAARAMHRDDEVGSIEPGKRADLLILSHDPTRVEPEYLREVAVEQTYVDGRRLYDRHGP